jgi:DNA-directed RNA polymerase sigma subunit (sigma70/sigma32)
MVEKLFVGNERERTTAWLVRKYQQLGSTRVEWAVDTAVDVLCARVESGKAPRAPIALFRTVARRQVGHHLILKDQPEIPRDPQSLDALPAPEPASDQERLRDQVRSEERTRLSREAVRCARQHLPFLGRGKIVAVMARRLDAIEAGHPERTAAEIGASLGITAATVRMLESRAIARLTKQVRLSPTPWRL